MKLSELCAAAGATLDDPAAGALEIARARGIEDAGEGDVAYVAGKNDKSYGHAATANPNFAAVTALIVPPDFVAPEGSRAALARAENPTVAFVKDSQILAPAVPHPASGVHPRAAVDPAATLGKNVAVGANAVIEAGAVIGDGTVVHPGTVVGAGAKIGANCVLYANVTIYYGCVLGDRCIIHSGAVIGADGFGFQWDGQQHLKVPQVGNVVIGNDVEIGANATVDRARFGSTVIGDGCKIDNLCQIAHNCRLGACCVLAGAVGVSGSVTLGNGVVAGGQVGFADHVQVGDGARFFAKSGVMNNIPAGALCGGQPAQEYKEGMRDYHNARYAARNFKDLVKRVEKLEKGETAK
ncbi:MAG: UDP-3-O-(3-hydroxymyristoyl)glucosamine N-acyltransferase [Planctomycetes bacterium]|nr:UDP-3-O-(3-hydroxymyristoyl)glucosamine N-acyltransferase [Planctomycetota bacterium]